MWKLIQALIATAVIATAAATVTRPVPGLAEAEQKPAAEPPVAFSPMMGALMNMFIQPRHARLGLAGREGNWELSGYALRQLQQAMAQVSAAVPRWKGLPVPDLFDAALSEPFAAVEAAIKAGDARQFGEAYSQLTAGCNACHATTDHPFVVLKAPEASEFPDQDFKPRR